MSNTSSLHTLLNNPTRAAVLRALEAGEDPALVQALANSRSRSSGSQRAS